ncbi:unnamed protein product [Coffea canephora]|uniref:DH200=94 genomic scaffold, scaffold_5380 n=1 Tax=Coffea canephora TaxID=49390 RepID=A0A068VLQ8_COFCA|nr:unnamed protein product [Coffea canephora]
MHSLSPSFLDNVALFLPLVHERVEIAGPLLTKQGVSSLVLSRSLGYSGPDVWFSSSSPPFRARSIGPLLLGFSWFQLSRSAAIRSVLLLLLHRKFSSSSFQARCGLCCEFSFVIFNLGTDVFCSFFHCFPFRVAPVLLSGEVRSCQPFGSSPPRS